MSFSQQISGFGVHAVKQINNVRRGVIIKLFGAVIRDTPVLSGRLRGNWQLTEDAPATTTLDAKAPNKASLSASEIQTVNKTDGDKPVFLANNLPYASKIEYDGWSHTKAPEGMVRRNVVRFGRLIQVEVAQNK